jgi:hypothetical protein
MTNPASEALKACEHCRSHQPNDGLRMYKNRMGRWQVHCRECDEYSYSHATEAEAITAWNRRAPTPIAAGRVTESEREAFIRLLDATDRFNGIYSCADRFASPYQGQMILAVQNAYSVLGIRRTEKHPPLTDAILASTGEPAAVERLREALQWLVDALTDPEAGEVDRRWALRDAIAALTTGVSAKADAALHSAMVASSEVVELLDAPTAGGEEADLAFVQCLQVARATEFAAIGTCCKRCGIAAPASFADDCDRLECEYREPGWLADVRKQVAEHATKPTEKAGDAEDGLLRAARNIWPYIEWTVGPESPGHHPTMPSAAGAFKDALNAALAKSGGAA